MGEFVKVAKTGELSEHSGMCVEVGDKKIALFRTEDGYCAIDDTCPHRGGPLSEGEVEGNEVTCPWHGAQFNIRSGDVLSPPASAGVASYNVRVSGDDIEIEV
ncbi:MAG: non-heme iron oxygenase ferredoxin subunit [Candidatus Tectomicrobia bacterium]|nr:non-heme iron oxygenase ferredoxin subunit [Candidatus Tectomicrobia bacterium]